jgi:sulfatase maturation enzyme AslB (radical SAM superfamily)
MTINLNNITSDAFCIAPWVNIHISQSNQIKPCCGGRGDFKSIENYVNGTDSSLIQLKQDLVNGNFSVFCQGCVEKEWYSEFLDQPTIVDSIDDFLIKSVDARWGITCQLSCMYCNSSSSSTWSQLKSKVIPIQSLKIYNDNVNKTFELIDSNRDQITRVSMLGGEPLLLKENLRLLDAINEDTNIDIFTNLNVDIDKNEIFQRLIERKNVNWYVSMETIGQRFEFVRRGAEWDRQIKNLQQLSSRSTLPITLQSQYCVYNALHLVELYEFTDTFNNVTVNLTSGVTRPEVLNFFLFPESFKIIALDQINRCISRYPHGNYQLMHVKELLESSMHTSTPDIVEKCILWHQEQESNYFKNRFDFLKLWPEYSVK